jgi:acetyltransferase
VAIALERLFNPRGIAVVGASADLSRPGGQTIRALTAYGYAGAIYPVNPNRGEIAGLRCYPSITAVEGDCDVAVIVLAAAQVPDVIDACGERGIPYAVVIGGGFRETGPEGAAIEADMLARARRHGIRFVGPNGLGLVNVHSHAFAAFGSLTREPELKAGGVSAVVQSGGFGNSLIIRCALAGVGFRYVVAGGNEADLNATELINAYVDDPHTRVILTYLEGVSDGRAFMAAARRALKAGKPILAWKAGRTHSGARAAATHTGNMTGNYHAWRAAFRQCGVIEVREVDEAAEWAYCLDCGRLPKGRRVAVMGGSGGSAVVFSDSADELGLTLPALSAQTEQAVRSALPAIGALRNPIDYTSGQPRPDKKQEFTQALEAVLHDPSVDQLAMTFATASTNQLQLAAEILKDVVERCDKPVMVFTPMSDELEANAVRIFREARIPVLRSPRAMARAMAMLASYAEARARVEDASEADGAFEVELPAGAATLDELESKRLLAAAGIPVTRDVPLAVRGALQGTGVRFPAVVKVLSRDIAHKTDIGGVRFGVADAAGLAAARDAVVSAAHGAVPGARISGALACETITDAVEMLVGVVNDGVFGPVVALAMGGIFAEASNTVAQRIAPFGPEDAKMMIAELGADRIMQGMRGQQPRDTEELARVLVQISKLAWQLRDRLVELDVNPLMLRAQGHGVVAADALVVLR